LSEVVAIIPARGGSVGIPRKNLAVIAGKPLVAWSIEHAQRSSRVSRIIVSTDDDEIAQTARSYGADVPFMRPAELAGNTVLDLPVFEHALRWLEEHEDARPDIVVHLRPTAPLRPVGQIDAMIGMLEERSDADSVRSVSKPGPHPWRMFTVDDAGFLRPLMQTPHKEPFLLRRQELPDIYWYNAVTDVTRRRTILEKHSMTGDRILPYVIDSKDVIDIDEPDDLLIASVKLQRFYAGQAT
jgi:CMP-N-acetylneuraminic acid synthetase